MNLDELQSVRDRERQTDQLQQLRESFYEEAAAFIQQLRDERERAAAQAENAFDDPEVTRLTDEIQTAVGTVEAIYEKRIGKIVKAASFDAAGLPSEAEGMTTEEQELFETLVDDIERNRERVFAVLDGDKPPDVTYREPEADEPTDESATDTDESEDEGVPAADLMGGGSDEPEQRAPTPPEPPGPPAEEEPPDEVPPETPSPEAEAATEQAESTEEAGEDAASDEMRPAAGAEPADDDAADIERTRVLITDDLDEFVGFDDQDYDLGENDVVTLPTPNATVLLEQGVAERLEEEPPDSA